MVKNKPFFSTSVVRGWQHEKGEVQEEIWGAWGELGLPQSKSNQIKSSLGRPELYGMEEGGRSRG